MTSEICSGLWFIAELCFILIAFCTTAVGTSCPGGVGSVKCVISTATVGALRREERHGKRRWVGWEKHDPSLQCRQSVGERARILWTVRGKGDKRGLCALVGRECPSLLEFPWCYLCLRLMVKLTGLLIDFAVSGPWDQPHRIWFRAVNCMVWLLYSWWGQKVAGINGATLLLNCQVNSVTPYFTDLTINGNNEQNSLCLPNCVKGSVSPPWSQICLE